MSVEVSDETLEGLVLLQGRWVVGRRLVVEKLVRDAVGSEEAERRAFPGVLTLSDDPMVAAIQAQALHPYGISTPAYDPDPATMDRLWADFQSSLQPRQRFLARIRGRKKSG